VDDIIFDKSPTMQGSKRVLERYICFAASPCRTKTFTCSSVSPSGGDGYNAGSSSVALDEHIFSDDDAAIIVVGREEKTIASTRIARGRAARVHVYCCGAPPALFDFVMQILLPASTYAHPPLQRHRVALVIIGLPTMNISIEHYCVTCEIVVYGRFCLWIVNFRLINPRGVTCRLPLHK
jgi:hypothetical protein